MSHFDLIIEGFEKDSKSKYPNYFNGRRSLEDLLEDKSATLSKLEANKIVQVARRDTYIKWRATDYILYVITENKKINIEVATSIVQEFLTDDSGYRNYCREKISEWMTIKGGFIKKHHIENILKFDVFKNKQDLVNYILLRSKASIKAFGSFVNMYPDHLSEKEIVIVKNRVKKLINKLTVNDKNASLILKALCNKEICDFISSDEEMKSNLIKFLPHFYTRDVQSEKMLVGKNVFSMYKNNPELFKKVQAIFVELVCNSYYRYENRIMQILKVEGTSPREAFAKIISLDKRADFLCKYFPELEKLRVLI